MRPLKGYRSKQKFNEIIIIGYAKKPKTTQQTPKVSLQGMELCIGNRFAQSVSKNVTDVTFFCYHTHSKAINVTVMTIDTCSHDSPRRTMSRSSCDLSPWMAATIHLCTAAAMTQMVLQYQCSTNLTRVGLHRMLYLQWTTTTIPV